MVAPNGNIDVPQVIRCCCAPLCPWSPGWGWHGYWSSVVFVFIFHHWSRFTTIFTPLYPSLSFSTLLPTPSYLSSHSQSISVYLLSFHPPLLPPSHPSNLLSFHPPLLPPSSPSTLPSFQPPLLPPSSPSTLPSFQPPLLPPSSPSTLPSFQPPLLPPSSPSTILSFHPPLLPTSSPSTLLSFHHPLLPPSSPSTLLSFHPPLLPPSSPSTLLSFHPPLCAHLPLFINRSLSIHSTRPSHFSWLLTSFLRKLSFTCYVAVSWKFFPK